MSFLRNLFIVLSLLLLVASCKKEDGKSTVSFDREALLIHYADDLILPATLDFQMRTDDLYQKSLDLKNNPDSARLSFVKQALEDAWMAYQWMAPIEFGPGEDLALRFTADIFPADTALIENNISTGSYDLTAIGNAPARGFPALDYLLFHKEHSAVVAELSQAGRAQYVVDLASQLRDLGAEMNSRWQNYRSIFVSSLGVDVGSSLGQFVNAFNKAHEVTKNARVGIPLGKRSLGQPFPEKVEAVYSGLSRKLLRENIIAEQAFFKGNSFPTGSDGLGLDDYLNTLEAYHGNRLLAEVIEDQFDQILLDEADLAVSLREAISVETPNVEVLYQDLQEQVIYLKTDMPSILGIQITYQDNDGD